MLHRFSTDSRARFHEAHICSKKAIDGWEDVTRDCLKHDAYRCLVLFVLITAEDPPQRLLETALIAAKSCRTIIETCALRGEIPEATLRLLLRHTDPYVSTTVAIGERNRDKSGPRESLVDEWRAAMIRAGDEDQYWLGEILAKDQELAFAWLSNLVTRRREERSFRLEDVVMKALATLSVEQRLQILAKVDGESGSSELVAQLVANSIEVYGALLRRDDLRYFHLAPLEGRPSASWPDKARLAMDSGHKPETVAEVAFMTSMSWTGPESVMWQGWEDSFRVFVDHPNELVRQAARHGLGIAQSRCQRAREEERKEDIYGLR